MSSRIDPAVESILAQLDALPGGPGDAEHELSVWRLVAAAPDDAAARGVLAAALQQHQLGTTIADWDEPTRSALTAVDVGPLRRAIRWTHPLDGGEMILIPAGKSLLGHPLQLRSRGVVGFSIGRFPVTNSQFQRFVTQSGYWPVGEAEHGRFLAHWHDDRLPEDRLDHPVVWVSALDAQQYCSWVSASLPTETMWERAARGSDGRLFPWGNSSPWPEARGSVSRQFLPQFRKPSDVAQLDTQETRPVGSFPDARSPFGCDDLVGNVSQWCEAPDPDSPTSPVRGACFYRRTFGTAVASHCRQLNTRRRNPWVGFRICVS